MIKQINALMILILYLLGQIPLAGATSFTDRSTLSTYLQDPTSVVKAKVQSPWSIASNFSHFTLHDWLIALSNLISAVKETPSDQSLLAKLATDFETFTDYCLTRAHVDELGSYAAELQKVIYEADSLVTPTGSAVVKNHLLASPFVRQWREIGNIINPDKEPLVVASGASGPSVAELIELGATKIYLLDREEVTVEKLQEALDAWPEITPPSDYFKGKYKTGFAYSLDFEKKIEATVIQELRASGVDQKDIEAPQKNPHARPMLIFRLPGQTRPITVTFIKVNLSYRPEMRALDEELTGKLNAYIEKAAMFSSVDYDRYLHRIMKWMGPNGHFVLNPYDMNSEFHDPLPFFKESYWPVTSPQLTGLNRLIYRFSRRTPYGRDMRIYRAGSEKTELPAALFDQHESTEKQHESLLAGLGNATQMPLKRMLFGKNAIEYTATEFQNKFETGQTTTQNILRGLYQANLLTRKTLARRGRPYVYSLIPWLQDCLDRHQNAQSRLNTILQSSSPDIAAALEPLKTSLLQDHQIDDAKKAAFFLQQLLLGTFTTPAALEKIQQSPNAQQWLKEFLPLLDQEAGFSANVKKVLEREIYNLTRAKPFSEENSKLPPMNQLTKTDIEAIGHGLKMYWNARGWDKRFGKISQHLAVITYKTAFPATNDGREKMHKWLAALTNTGLEDQLLAQWTSGVYLALHLKKGQHFDESGKQPDAEELVRIARHFISLLLANPDMEMPLPEATVDFNGQRPTASGRDLMLWGLACMLDPTLYDPFFDFDHLEDTHPAVLMWGEGENDNAKNGDKAKTDYFNRILKNIPQLTAEGQAAGKLIPDFDTMRLLDELTSKKLNDWLAMGLGSPFKYADADPAFLVWGPYGLWNTDAPDGFVVQSLRAFQEPAFMFALPKEQLPSHLAWQLNDVSANHFRVHPEPFCLDVEKRERYAQDELKRMTEKVGLGIIFNELQFIPDHNGWPQFVLPIKIKAGLKNRTLTNFLDETTFFWHIDDIAELLVAFDRAGIPYTEKMGWDVTDICHLVDNALDAIAEPRLNEAKPKTIYGMIRIALRQENQELYLEIEDTGGGFTEKALGPAFEKINSTKFYYGPLLGKGGKGLMLVRKAAIALGASRIEIETKQKNKPSLKKVVQLDPLVFGEIESGNRQSTGTLMRIVIPIPQKAPGLTERAMHTAA